MPSMDKGLPSQWTATTILISISPKETRNSHSLTQTWIWTAKWSSLYERRKRRMARSASSKSHLKPRHPKARVAAPSSWTNLKWWAKGSRWKKRLTTGSSWIMVRSQASTNRTKWISTTSTSSPTKILIPKFKSAPEVIRIKLQKIRRRISRSFRYINARWVK